MKFKYFRAQLILVMAGIGLGLIARSIVGPPPEKNENRFLTPSPVIDSFDPFHDEADELLINPESDATGRDEPGVDNGAPRQPMAANDGGLVPPIQLTLREPDPVHHYTPVGSADPSSDAHFWDHDATAEFEPHGEQLCASGCALSRHPTRELVFDRYEELMNTYAGGGPGEFAALEELLYFGPQTRKMIQARGCEGLDSERREFLQEQLEATHALISIRVVDEHGEVRTWVDATRVPLDRRHVFRMETKNLQPLVTSGTVKRVGLDHLWVRL